MTAQWLPGVLGWAEWASAKNVLSELWWDDHDDDQTIQEVNLARSYAEALAFLPAGGPSCPFTAEIRRQTIIW